MKKQHYGGSTTFGSSSVRFHLLSQPRTLQRALVNRNVNVHNSNGPLRSIPYQQFNQKKCRPPFVSTGSAGGSNDRGFHKIKHDFPLNYYGMLSERVR
jgi:hypothetical protein